MKKTERRIEQKKKKSPSRSNYSTDLPWNFKSTYPVGPQGTTAHWLLKRCNNDSDFTIEKFKNFKHYIAIPDMLEYLIKPEQTTNFCIYRLQWHTEVTYYIRVYASFFPIKKWYDKSQPRQQNHTKIYKNSAKGWGRKRRRWSS